MSPSLIEGAASVNAGGKGGLVVFTLEKSFEEPRRQPLALGVKREREGRVHLQPGGV